MDDIVERLRWHSNGDSSIHDVCKEAADEIERLRSEIAHTIKHGVSAAQLQETVE